MAGHAILSPSGAHRWLNCTPSARLELEFEDTESEAAAEGTAAHALAEHKLRKALRMRSARPVSKYDSDEMELHTDGYAEFVLEAFEQTKLRCADPLVLIEQHLDFSRYVPDGYGTGDCVIVGDGALHIIDFKYGRGVLVEVERNPQLMLYALGALEIFDSLYDISDVSMSIYQPRRENACTWTVSADSLRAWAENELKPRAERAFNGEGDYRSGEWCRFCRAAVKCRARTEEKLTLVRDEFARPPLLSDAEIEDILGVLDELSRWAEDIRTYALDAALNRGKQWNGWKVVAGRSVRQYSDENAVAQTAIAAGYRDIYRKSLIPLGEMERLLGKDRFNELLGGLISKPPGKPALVPVSDKRPAIAANPNHEFKEDT